MADMGKIENDSIGFLDPEKMGDRYRYVISSCITYVVTAAIIISNMADMGQD